MGKNSQQQISIFGIRHHGPGSARSLIHALSQLSPDCLLIEGPPDADELIRLAHDPATEPPVALMIYHPDNPKLAAFYPFAEFSPEWQAIRFGLERDIPVRFMDLPQTHQLALQQERLSDTADMTPEETSEPEKIHEDPLNRIAQAAGYGDGEDWWDHIIEQRTDSADVFAALAEAMTVFRKENTLPKDENYLLSEARREAYMRKTIRAAQKENFKNIAVVCGAWHTPALENTPLVKEDNEILKALPKIKVQATWVPWTYQRLTYSSGYGAGVHSPGWYRHLWRYGGKGSDTRTHIISNWLVRIARLMRRNDLDISTAHVIETMRMAETLAALRSRPLPGLEEISEALISVMFFGDSFPMRLIEKELLIGNRLGKIPANAPTLPLQRDIELQQKAVKLKALADTKDYDLDLRKPIDRSRSHLLHRLLLLDIPWGELKQSGQRQKGTFHEIWVLQWKPEFAISVAEASVWGNTVETAACQRVAETARDTRQPGVLAELINKVLLADLSAAVHRLIVRLNEIASLSNDVAEMMNVIPPLVNVMRYGDVRATDAEMVRPVVFNMLTRICISLPGACSSLDNGAAGNMLKKIQNVHNAVRLIQDDEKNEEWLRVISQLADTDRMNGILAGFCCRLMLDTERFTAEDAATRMSLALSSANDPVTAAGWSEGFLKGSGMILLHDNRLWQVLDDWVRALSEDQFKAILPLIRRSFALFTEPERRQIGEKARLSMETKTVRVAETLADFNRERAEKVIPVLLQLLGSEKKI